MQRSHGREFQVEENVVQGLKQKWHSLPVVAWPCRIKSRRQIGTRTQRVHWIPFGSHSSPEKQLFSGGLRSRPGCLHTTLQCSASGEQPGLLSRNQSTHVEVTGQLGIVSLQHVGRKDEDQLSVLLASALTFKPSRQPQNSSYILDVYLNHQEILVRFRFSNQGFSLMVGCSALIVKSYIQMLSQERWMRPKVVQLAVTLGTTLGSKFIPVSCMPGCMEELDSLLEPQGQLLHFFERE